jgi:radical SAM superfamily enzyme YgiQ (UPF0313 family)
VIKKRIVPDLDGAYFPADQIVPNIQIVHDRIAIEVMRGCKHACAFCQASAIYRPCRERSRDTIIKIAKEAYLNTGYDEISCLSLSTADHSDIHGIIKDLNREFAPLSVSVSVPSLRVEDAAADLPELVAKVRKSGLTFAPEAGSEKLRKRLNKLIDIEKLFNAIEKSFIEGWKSVKLYFMFGLPGEDDPDLSGIVDMLYKVSDLRRKVSGRSADVRASVNAFIPKAHTPFQWEAMDTKEALERKRSLLRGSMHSKRIEMDFHSIDMSRLEAVFARGDRALGNVIYDAWASGARFDGWTEYFDPARWSAAFARCGIDPDFYASRKRDFGEALPWDHIDMGAPKAALIKIRENLFAGRSE